MAIQKVNVVVADEYQNRFSEIVKRCQSAGLQVEQEMESIGVFTGSIDSAKIPELEQAEGIAAVEQSRDYQIAPPDSSIQSQGDRKPG